jgi:hypothetical protein
MAFGYKWVAPPPDISGEMDALTKSLVSIQQRRTEKERRDREEERQAQLDQLNRDLALAQEGRAVQEFEQGKMEHELDMESAKFKHLLAKQGVEQRKFELQAEQSDMQARDAFNKAQNKAEQELTKNEVPRGKAWNEAWPDYFDEKGKMKPYTGKAVGVFEGTMLKPDLPSREGPLYPLQTLGERIREQAAAAQNTPQVLSALVRANTKSPARDYVGEYRQKMEIEKELGVGKFKNAEGKSLPREKIDEFGALESTTAQLMELASLPSGPVMEAVGWVPNIIRNMAGRSGEELTEEAALNLAQKYQSYQPEYFMFAVELLKQKQGSRPSDFDMRVYLENLPKISDTADAKARKIHSLMKTFARELNTGISSWKRNNYYVPYEEIVVPSVEELYDMIPKGDVGGPDLPPGAVLDE